MNLFNYKRSEVDGFAKPTLYPGEPQDGIELPSEISTTQTKLNSILEGKYSVEYLKVCAFYNKRFPSLKSPDWSICSYNVSSFTSLDQERTDTGTGMSCNYLKQIVDQVVSRIGTLSFTPHLLSETPTFDFLLYKNSAERFIKSYIRKSDFVNRCLEVFHDAAVLGYSHVFIDPWTHKFVKASDFEVGMFQAEVNKGKVKRMLYRDYDFPVTELGKHLPPDMLVKFKDKETVDVKMLFDCTLKKAYITVDSVTAPPIDYPHEYVLVATFIWDVGITRTTTTSLFDLLYPIQREINKINAKIQQLIRMYKGPVPVFNSDVDLSMKEISNGSGEALYVDSSRPIDTLMTVINPTPLDDALGAEIESHKTQMYELAGIQQMSFDMENMRSAAAVVALDQMRDSTFQAQIQTYTSFITKCLIMFCEDVADLDEEMSAVCELIKHCYVKLEPVHMNDPMSDDKAKDADMQPDYMTMLSAKIVKDVAEGRTVFATLPYWIRPDDVTTMVLTLILQLEAAGADIPLSLNMYLVDAFINDVKEGKVGL